MKKSEQLRRKFEKDRRANKITSGIFYAVAAVLFTVAVLVRILRPISIPYDAVYYAFVSIATLMFMGLNLISYNKASRYLNQAEEDIQEMEEKGE